MPSPTTTAPARSLPQLSERAASASSSAIRDLLDQAKRPGMISLAGGLPDASRFPLEQLAQIAHDAIATNGAETLQYSLTAGDRSARQSMAMLFNGAGERPSFDLDRMVVTTGSQQALDLIARVVVDPGDQVVTGDPDYLGSLQVFRSYGADVRPIAIDAQGLDTTQLEDEMKWGLRPTCCYIVQHFHNPSGSTMSAERRAHLDELSDRYGFLIIEDDPYRELYFDEPPQAHVANPELTVQLRSTSKTLAPGLRVGALAGPSWLIDPVVTAKQSADLHTSTLSQAVVANALESDWFPTHLGDLRELYRGKRDALAAALATTFGDQAHYTIPAGGMFLWVRFEGVGDTSQWLARCLDNGACFVPGAAFAVTRDLSRYARLSFATGSVAELETAVDRLHASI